LSLPTNFFIILIKHLIKTISPSISNYHQAWLLLPNSLFCGCPILIDQIRGRSTVIEITPVSASLRASIREIGVHNPYQRTASIVRPRKNRTRCTSWGSGALRSPSPCYPPKEFTGSLSTPSAPRQ